MTEETYTFHYHRCALNRLSDPLLASLVRAAREATYTAYAPYSHFYVGAAVLLSDGSIVTGNNQENAAFGAGTCAERTALFYAHASKPTVKVEALAVTARGEDDRFSARPVSPCGICRQVLIETQQRAGHPIKVLLCGSEDILIVDDAKQLLPFAFETF